MINTSNKDDFGWGNKIPTTGPSNLTNGPILDHSVLKGKNTFLLLYGMEEYISVSAVTGNGMKIKL